MFMHAAVLVAFASAAVSAIPLSARAGSDTQIPSSCKLMGISTLGFNTTGIEIYSKAEPFSWVAWDLDPYGPEDPFKTTLQNSDVPQSGRYSGYYSCKNYAQAQQKGDVSVDVGVIADLRIPGNCYTASALKQNDITLITSPCDFSSGSPASNQKFLFTGSTFQDYKEVILLADEELPADKYNPTTHYTVGSTKIPTTFTLNYSESPVVLRPNTTLAFNEHWFGSQR